MGLSAHGERSPQLQSWEVHSCDLKRLRQMVKEYEPYIPYGNTSDWNFRYLDDLVRERGIGQKKRNEMQK